MMCAKFEYKVISIPTSPEYNFRLWLDGTLNDNGKDGFEFFQIISGKIVLVRELAKHTGTVESLESGVVVELLGIATRLTEAVKSSKDLDNAHHLAPILSDLRTVLAKCGEGK